jgi:hypothetical protein
VIFRRPHRRQGAGMNQSMPRRGRRRFMPDVIFRALAGHPRRARSRWGLEPVATGRRSPRAFALGSRTKVPWRRGRGI